MLDRRSMHNRLCLHADAMTAKRTSSSIIPGTDLQIVIPGTIPV